jgi:hypothetical protein
MILVTIFLLDVFNDFLMILATFILLLILVISDRRNLMNRI